MAAHDRLSSGHQRAVLQSHRVSRLSPSPSDTGDGRSTSPSGASLRSFASSSTLDSMTYDGAAPPLPAVIAVRECVLRKRPPTAPGPGWGFVLRGTTSEYAEGTKVHTCHIESIHEDGTAKVRMCGPWGGRVYEDPFLRACVRACGEVFEPKRQGGLLRSGGAWLLCLPYQLAHSSLEPSIC